MINLVKPLFLLAVICLNSYCIAQKDDIDDLIQDVFKNPNQNENVNPSTSSPPNNVDRSQDGKPNTDSKPNPLNNNANSCTCVPYYLCNNGSVNTNGVGLLDIRINDGPCESYLEMCCDPQSVTDKPITPAPPQRKGCGYRNPEGIGFRITGEKDNEAQFGEFPWMVAILREESVDGNPQKLNVYQCGGALIHSRAVLTAAHCVSDKKRKFKIRAGEWDTQTTKELHPHQDMEVETVITHPQYYAGALYYDVAILILKNPVTIAENVDVVCMPPPDAVFDNSRCFASGWGKDVFGKEGKYQVILKKIDLPVVPHNTCQSRLRETRLGKFFELHKSFICAGGEPGKDTCKGDGGSPLVCPIQGQADRYYQAGIVAWGIGCGDSNTPGVYGNVALFRSWIDDQFKAKGLDLQYVA